MVDIVEFQKNKENTGADFCQTLITLSNFRQLFVIFRQLDELTRDFGVFSCTFFESLDKLFIFQQVIIFGVRNQLKNLLFQPIQSKFSFIRQVHVRNPLLFLLRKINFDSNIQELVFQPFLRHLKVHNTDSCADFGRIFRFSYFGSHIKSEIVRNVKKLIPQLDSKGGSLFKELFEDKGFEQRGTNTFSQFFNQHWVAEGYCVLQRNQ